MNILILAPIIIGLFLFIFSLIMAFKTSFSERKMSLKLFLYLFLMILSIFWVVIGFYAYFIIQSQLAN